MIKMHNLPHIASRMFGTPLMLARPKLDVLLSVVGPRLTGLSATLNTQDDALDEPVSETAAQITSDGVAIIPVFGTLVMRSSYLSAVSGLTSYADVGERIETAMTDSAVRAIMLEMDSPGGEVGGLFDLCDQIASLQQAYGKPIWALAHESALSAAYAIACCADRVVVTQTGEVGSIGVVAVHVDESNADKKAGLAWNFIYAGDRKVDANGHEPLSDRARADIQSDVDQLYEQFVALVAKNRSLSADAIRATEAGTYRGELAVSAGLADTVMSRDAALAALGGSVRPSLSFLNPNRKDTSMNAQNPVTEVQQPEVAANAAPAAAQATAAENSPAPMAAAPAQVMPDASAIEARVTQKLREDYGEMAQVAAQAARLGVNLDVADAMARGVKPDAMRRAVLDELATRSSATNVIAATTTTATSVDSPIIRRARAAAEKAKA